MQDTKDHADSPSGTRGKVWTSLITTTLGAIASLVSALVSSADLFRLPMAIVAAVATVLASAAFTFVVVRHERGTSPVRALRHQLVAAYVRALDGSRLNPIRSTGK